jgi:hypothetical protein
MRWVDSILTKSFLDHQMVRLLRMNWKERGCSLFHSTVPAFAYMDYGISGNCIIELQNIAVRTVCLQAKVCNYELPHFI